MAAMKMEKGVGFLIYIRSTGFPDGSGMSYEEVRGVHKVVRQHGITNKVSLEKGRGPRSEAGGITTIQQGFGNTGLIFH